MDIIEIIVYIFSIFFSLLFWSFIAYLINNDLLKAKFKYVIYISFLDIFKSLLFWVILVLIIYSLIHLSISFFHYIFPLLDYIDDIYSVLIYISISLLYFLLYLFVFNKFFSFIIKKTIPNNYFYDIFFIFCVIYVFLMSFFLYIFIL